MFEFRWKLTYAYYLYNTSIVLSQKFMQILQNIRRRRPFSDKKMVSFGVCNIF